MNIFSQAEIFGCLLISQVNIFKAISVLAIKVDSLIELEKHVF